MRVSALIVGFAALGAGGGLLARGATRIGVHQGYAPEQPIAFPHSVHAGDNKIPCLYCHSGARTSRHAGIPAASVCMNCHSLIEKQTTEIQRLKESVQQGRPIVGPVQRAKCNHVSFLRQGAVNAERFTRGARRT